MKQEAATVRLTVDRRAVDVPAGATILQAAKQLGIFIPTMCHRDGFEPSTSCMVCVVEVVGQKNLLPACGALAGDGMEIFTSTEKVVQARKTAIELLLSEHAGDCLAPCQTGCPADMNIPLMIEQILAGRVDLAIETIKRDIALPAVLGRICPAPCEKVCRRKDHDQPVAICLLKRFAADDDLGHPNPYRPVCKEPTGKKVAIIGAGPAGLSAAYYLTQQGVKCVVFDKFDKPGGALRNGPLKQVLPDDVLDRETSLIFSLGPEFRGCTEIGKDISFEQICAEYDAVFAACGGAETHNISSFGLEMSEKGVRADAGTYQTSRQGVFAGGRSIGRTNLCVRAAADGKEAAESIVQYLSGRVVGVKKRFNSRLGQVSEQEMQSFLSGASPEGRIEPAGQSAGYLYEQAQKEAQRCLHCQCAKPENCLLREQARQNQARQRSYKGQRKPFIRQNNPAGVVFEQGKCILCGLCIQQAQRQGLELCFERRGYESKIAVPFDKGPQEGLKNFTVECASVCPTGALAIRKKM